MKNGETVLDIGSNANAFAFKCILNIFCFLQDFEFVFEIFK